MNSIPVIVAAIGVIIHALGLLDLIPHPEFISDLSMFFIDILVVYGLMKKTVWGYWLAVALYLQQSLMQPYWAYQKYVSHFYIVHPIEYFVASILVISSLFILIFNKQYFVNQR